MNQPKYPPSNTPKFRFPVGAVLLCIVALSFILYEASYLLKGYVINNLFLNVVACLYYITIVAFAILMFMKKREFPLTVMTAVLILIRTIQLSNWIVTNGFLPPINILRIIYLLLEIAIYAIILFIVISEISGDNLKSIKNNRSRLKLISFILLGIMCGLFLYLDIYWYLDNFFDVQYGLLDIFYLLEEILLIIALFFVVDWVINPFIKNQTVTPHYYAPQTLQQQVYTPIQTPMQQPMQIPMQQPMQIPMQQPMQIPMQQPMQIPMQQPMQIPMQQPMQTPIQQPIQPQFQQPVQTPFTPPRATAPVQTPPTPTAVSKATAEADALKKYKEMMDNGLITEEEYNAKKKQLLGL